MKKPNQPLYSTQLSEYYQAHDLYVGAVVQFNSHKFVIIDADEYAYNYLERHMNEVARIMGQRGDLFLMWITKNLF